MDMDLVVIFSFVTIVTLIVTAGIVLLPISRKLGVYLEEAAIARRDARLSGEDPSRERQVLTSAPPELLDALTRLESQIGHVAERQAFVEQLVEDRQLASSDPGRENS